MRIRRERHESEPEPGLNRVFRSPNGISPAFLWQQQRLATVPVVTPNIERGSQRHQYAQIVQQTQTKREGRILFGSQDFVYPVFAAPTGVVEGEMMIASVKGPGAAFSGGGPGVIIPPSGWDTVMDIASQFDARTRWGVYTKIADSVDAVSGRNYTFQVGGPGTGVKYVGWLVTHVGLGGGTALGTPTTGYQYVDAFDPANTDHTVSPPAGGEYVIGMHLMNKQGGGGHNVLLYNVTEPPSGRYQYATYQFGTEYGFHRMQAHAGGEDWRFQTSVDRVSATGSRHESMSALFPVLAP